MEISVKTGGLEVGTGNDTIVEENEKAEETTEEQNEESEEN